MTLYQFKLLDEMEQIEKIWESPLIAKRSDEEFDYELYQIRKFYAELRYLKGEKAINNLKTFENPDLLQPYFSQIDISKLK